MKFFCEMIEHMRSHGMLDKVTESNISVSDTEWEYFSKCQPFAFFDDRVDDPIDRASLPEQIDAPFPVFSIETLGNVACALLTKGHEDEELGAIWCMIVVESAPNQYRIYAYFSPIVNGRTGEKIVIKADSDQPDLAAILKHHLKKIANWNVGVETVRHTIKIGIGKSKRIRRIRRIIHVIPKRELVRNPNAFREINWTHRFNVRGHWRKINGLGKDREGQYRISGHTWVNEHEKGPDHLPLITKVRVVKTEVRNDQA